MYQLRDQMTPVMERIRKTANKMSKDSVKSAQKMSINFKEVGKTAKEMGKELALVGGAITAPLALMTREAMQFEKGVAELATLMPTKTLGGVKEEFNGMLLDISKTFGKGSEDVVKSAYQAISAGVPASKEALGDFMAVASQASVAGVTSLETAVDGITSVMNAFKTEGQSATAVSDKMFTAVRLGKTTFSELSQAMFQVAPTASGLGIKFGEVTSAIASVTAKGVPTKIVTTQMRAMLVELSKSSTKVSQVFKRISGKSFPEFIKGGGSMEQALNMIREKADKAGVQLADIFSSVEAGAIAMNLTGENASDYASALRETEKASGASKTAFDKMADSASFDYDKSISGLKATSITIGEQLLPMVSGVTRKLAGFMGMISNFIKENPNLSHAIIVTTAVLGVLLTGLGTFGFIAGSIVSGFTALSAGFVALAGALGFSTVSFSAFTASVWASTVAILANPITWIVVGVVALGVAIYKLIKNWDAVKEAVTNAFISAYNSVAEFYNKYRGIIAVLALPLLPFILAVKGVIWLWKQVYKGIKWVIDKISPWLSKFGDDFGVVFGEMKAFWNEYFGTFGDDVMIAFQPVLDALGWIEEKARTLFKMLGIDLPEMELMVKEKIEPVLQSADYFNGAQDFNQISMTPVLGDANAEKSIMQNEIPVKQATTVNVKSDVGGTLKIEIDNKGNAKVKESKPNGNLGYQVGGV
jgi:TP901 family phage tail tape measure protein